MENYQIIGLIIGLIGVVIGLIVAAGIPFLGFIMIAVNVIAIALVFGMQPKLNQNQELKLTWLGIFLIVLGVFASWLLIIPGVIALRYKKPQPVSNGNTFRLGR